MTEADIGGVVLAGDAAGGDPAAAGADGGGDSSCAKPIEQTNKAEIEASRILIG